jgi:hypothetical protein
MNHNIRCSKLNKMQFEFARQDETYFYDSVCALVGRAVVITNPVIHQKK